MNATKSLAAYGFTQTDDGLVLFSGSGKPRTRYVPVPGGFNRFEWEDGAWRQYPHSIHKDWEGIAGLAFDQKQGDTDPNSRVKPECFEWVYPEDWVAAQYTAREG